MSRIRSTHPGVWTDERFVSVSPFARLLFMGIWNECDDYGSFEWSPLKLKMRLLPADSVDAAALMAELEEAGSIRCYEIDGKPYGAVRNFCQYQRPKKPTHVHPQSPEVEAWVNIEARSTRDGSEEVVKELPTDGVKSRQRKDEGGKGRPVSAKAKTGEARKRAVPAFELPDWVPAEPWAAFEAMRKAMGPKVPFTDEAKRGIVRELEELRGQGHDPAKLLLKAVKKGWRSLFGGDDTRAANGRAAAPMNAEQIRAGIRFAEDNQDPDRAAELKRQLDVLQKPPDPHVAGLVRGVTDKLAARH
jgi:hypothetical protein